MHLLDNPQNDFQIIHIAGPRGRVRFPLCVPAFSTQGYKTGLYTSPHMVNFAERIQVNGDTISKAELVTIVETLKSVVAQVPEITTFELTTALAFVYFSKVNVDYAIVEVGLGGRLDAQTLFYQ